MNSYTMQALATSRQNDLLAEADRARRAKAARHAAHGSPVTGRHPLIWLKDAVGGFAFRLTSPTHAHRVTH